MYNYNKSGPGRLGLLGLFRKERKTRAIMYVGSIKAGQHNLHCLHLKPLYCIYIFTMVVYEIIPCTKTLTILAFFSLACDLPGHLIAMTKITSLLTKAMKAATQICLAVLVCRPHPEIGV